jgi:hypothetical protein
MTTTDLALLGSGEYVARVTPLKTGGRRDIEVTQADPDMPVSFRQTDILAALRRFFDALDAEADLHADDPVATAQALARMEALLADVRYVRDRLKSLTATALQAERIRRLTVSDIVTVEGTTEVKRSGWEHARLLTTVLIGQAQRLINVETGEVMTAEESAALLLEMFRPEWKLTAIREMGLDPDEFCHVETDDDGKPIRTPSLRMVDNVVRRITEVGR